MERHMRALRFVDWDRFTYHEFDNGAFAVPPTLYCVHGEEAVEMEVVSEAGLLEEAMVEA
jgi:hypothetical protein